MKNAKVSIIFPNCNGDIQQIRKLLKSVENQHISVSEIIMVDNNSTLKYLQKIEKVFPKLKIIKNKTNLGFSESINQGAQRAQGDFLFITNNDVQLEENCIKTLIIFLKTHPKVTAVGPVSYTNKSHQKLDIGVLRYSLTSGFFKTFFSPKPMVTDWIPGSGMLISKKNFQHFGRYDPAFFFYYEDVDFGLRVKKLGFNLVTIPNASIIHYRGSTAHKSEYHWFRYYHLHKGRQLLLFKQGNIFQIGFGLFLELFIFAIYHGIILRDGSVLPMLSATVENFKFDSLKAIIRSRRDYKKWLSKNLISQL